MAETPADITPAALAVAGARDAAPSAVPLALVFLLCLAIGFQPLPFDPDLWFHLAGGQAVLDNLAVPDADPFSFTRAGESWIPHSWLFDAFLALGWNVWGPRMLEAGAAAAFAACFLLSFAILTRQRVAPLTAVALCLGLAIAAGNTRGLRPQLLSLLLCNLLIWLLGRHRESPSRRLVVLAPLLFLLWAQIHAACVLGLIVIAVWLAGRALDLALDRTRATGRDELLALLAALGLSALAVMATPHRISHFEYVALTAGLDALRYTSEWQPPKPLSLEVPDVYLFALLAVVIIVLARRARRVGWAELFLGITLLVLACSGVRHIPLACIAAVPLFAGALGRDHAVPLFAGTLGRDHTVPLFAGALGRDHAVPLFAGALGRDHDQPVPTSSVLPAQRGGLMLAAVLLLALLWRFPNSASARYAAVEPVAGARALAVLGQPRNVFTTYNTGSYVLWSAPGRLRVFIDSRADVYGDAVAADARNIQRGRGWEEAFARWHITAAVVQRGDPLARILARHGEWQILAEDPTAITFVRRDSLPAGYATDRARRPLPA